MKHHTACIATAMSLVSSPTFADDVAFQRDQLKNGIRTIIVHTPEAPRQTTFTFLPMTLVNDEPHRAQWSHLVEHMLIRSTDPIELAAPGLMLNGETTHMYLRMETFADKDHWKQSLQKHAKWLSARTFDADALQREKNNIQLEEENTALQGFTSKFALAAWNQIIWCGLDHAAVHADIADAKLDDVQAYTAAHVPIDDSVLIASIGPVPEADVRAELERLFGSMAAAHPKPQAPTEIDPKSRRDRETTWDLPTREAMWWWKLPDAKPATLAAATCVARSVQTQFLMNQGLRAQIRQLLVYPCVTNASGSFFIVDCCLVNQEQVKLDQVWTTVQSLISELREGGTARPMVNFMSSMLLQETPSKPDFNLLRQQLPPMVQGNAECVWFLAVLNYEYSWGIPAPQVFDALQNLDQQSVKQVVDLITGEPAGSLLLRPKEKATVVPPGGH